MGADSRSQDTSRRWANQPGVAWLVRVFLWVMPFVAGWVALRFSQPYFLHSDRFDLVLWIFQAVVVSSVVAYGVTRIARRFTPLVWLFDLSLVFPDHAPSRFGVALRASSLKKLHSRTEATALSNDVQTAAEEAVALVMALGKHDRLTRGHTERVRAYADVIGQEMGLPDEDLEKLRWGVLLHDIGKVNVPASILNKPGQPTPAEWAVLRTHPATGAEMLRPLEGWLGQWVRAAGEHHERWDGSGYPCGLAGTDISLAGRIAAVADAYDVITSTRSYKSPLSSEAARQELVACSGTDFDPVVVRAMLNAGLRKPTVRLSWAWLLELPAVARVATLAAANQVAVTVGSVATVVAVASGVTAPVNVPDSLAFGESPVVVADDGLPDEPSLDAVDAAGAARPAVDETADESPTDVASESTSTTIAGAPSDDIVTSTTSIVATTTTAPTTTTTTAPTTTTTTAPTTTTTAAPTTTTTPAPPTDCERAQGGDGDLAGADLAGCDLSGLALTNFDLSGADLAGADLRGLQLADGTMVGANLPGAQLDGIDAERVDFGSTNLAGLSGPDARFRDVSFGFANLAGADFSSSTFEGVNFNDADISDAVFVGSDLQGTEFFRTTAVRTEFGATDLRAARLEGNFRQAWFDDADLRTSTLNGANLQQARLMFTDLEGATGTPAEVSGAQFANTICPDGSVTSVGCW